MKNWLIFFFFLLFSLNLWAQEKNKQTQETKRSKIEELRADTLPKPSVLDQKIFWGFVFLNGWSSVSENESYFFKPSLGGGIRVDYYFAKSLGLSVGLNYQQRGTGVKTTDYDNSLGNADSTHRLRLRFNSLEVPISLLFKSPKGLFGGKGVRFLAGAGLTPQMNFQTTRFFNSAEDGFHDISDVSANYYTFDTSLDINAGFLISAGEKTAFLTDVFMQFGTQNVYKTANLSGKNRYWGLRIAFLF